MLCVNKHTHTRPNVLRQQCHATLTQIKSCVRVFTVFVSPLFILPASAAYNPHCKTSVNRDFRRDRSRKWLGKHSTSIKRQRTAPPVPRSFPGLVAVLFACVFVVKVAHRPSISRPHIISIISSANARCRLMRFPCSRRWRREMTRVFSIYDFLLLRHCAKMRAYTQTIYCVFNVQIAFDTQCILRPTHDHPRTLVVRSTLFPFPVYLYIHLYLA